MRIRERLDKLGLLQNPAKRGRPSERVGKQLRRQLAAAKMLVESFGADIEARTALGRTPLHLAAAQGFPQVVEFLMAVSDALSACLLPSADVRTGSVFSLVSVLRALD